MSSLKNLLAVNLFICAISAVVSLYADESEPSPDPPGKFDVCWVGNTFPGNGGNNGEGYWVQQGADEIEVGPNGLVAAGCGWELRRTV